MPVLASVTSRGWKPMARNLSATAASEAASTLPSRKLPELSRTLYEYVVVICVSFRSGPRPVAGADPGEEVRPVRAVLQTHLRGDPTRPHSLGQVGVEIGRASVRE